MLYITLGNEENDKVFVSIVKKFTIEFCPLIPEFAFGVVVRCHSAVAIAYAQRITIKHHAKNTGNGNAVVVGHLNVDF